MSQVKGIPSDLIKPFKILIHRILAYGEDEATLDVYVDSEGGNDIEYQHFQAGTYNSRHRLDSDEKIDKFLGKICDDVTQGQYSSDEGNRVVFQIHALNKTMIVDVHEFYREETDDSTHYTYEEMLSRFDNYDELIDSIKDMGKYVEVSYDGGGDSGWINSTYTSSRDRDISRDFANEIDQQFQDVIYDLLSSNFGAWGDNDGSQGTIRINTETKEIEIFHTEFSQDSRLYESVITYDLTKPE